MQLVMTDSEDEFTRCVRQSQAFLRRTAYALCGDWHEADDLVQDTLVVIYGQWASLSDRTELAGYMRTVLTRKFISSRRSNRRWREILAVTPLTYPAAPDEFTRLDDRDLLLAALGQLGPRQRAIVVLRCWEGLSVNETASILKISPKTVASQMSRALAHLRGVLRSAPALLAPS